METKQTKFITERMKSVRQQKHLSQKELASRTMFAPSTISSIENGLINPSERAVHLIAQALGKKVEYFTNPAVLEKDSDEIEEGAKAVTLAEPVVTETISPPGPATMSLDIVRLTMQGGNYQAAIEKLRLIEQTSLNEVERQRFDYYYAQTLSRTREIRQARRLLTDLREQLQIRVYPAPAPSLLQVLFELGVTYQLEQQFDDAIEEYLKIIELLGNQVDQDAMGFKVYTELGRIYRQKGVSSKAAEYYQKAQQHQYANKDDRIMANLLLSEGLNLSESGKLTEAHQKLQESTRLYEKLEMLEQARTVSSFLEVVQAELGQFEENLSSGQIEAETDLLENLAKTSNATNEVVIMCNRAAVLRLKGRNDTSALEEAVTQTERTLQFVMSKEAEIDKVTVAEVYFEAAQLWVAKNDQERALAAFEQALAVLRKSNAPWPKYEAIYKQYQQSLLNWNKAEELLRMIRQSQEDEIILKNKSYQARRGFDEHP